MQKLVVLGLLVLFEVPVYEPTLVMRMPAEAVLGCYASTKEMLRDFEARREDLKGATRVKPTKTKELEKAEFVLWHKKGEKWMIEYRLDLRREDCPGRGGYQLFYMKGFYPTAPPSFNPSK